MAAVPIWTELWVGRPPRMLNPSGVLTTPGRARSAPCNVSSVTADRWMKLPSSVSRAPSVVAMATSWDRWTTSTLSVTPASARSASTSRSCPSTRTTRAVKARKPSSAIVTMVGPADRPAAR